MAIEIKLLGPRDAEVLAHVDPDVFDDPIHIGRAKEFLNDPRHHLAVAVEDGLVVGFVSAVHYVHPDKPRPELWINEVGVAATHRRRGLGKRLLGAILDNARELGCAEAWVLTDRDNTAAMRLYVAAGSTKAPADHVMFTFRLGTEAIVEGNPDAGLLKAQSGRVMEVEYVVTMDDYVDFSLHVSYSSGIAFGVYILGWFVIPLFPLLLAAVTLVGVGVNWQASVGSLVLAAAMVILAVLAAATYPFTYNGLLRWYTRAFAAQRGVRGMIGRIRLILTHETLTEITNTTRSEIRWRDIARVEEVGDVTYIFVTGISAALVPRRGFVNDEEYYLVRDFARSRVGYNNEENQS
jgi:GNAT superfamily N-acetyltransferase